MSASLKTVITNCNSKAQLNLLTEKDAIELVRALGMEFDCSSLIEILSESSKERSIKLLSSCLKVDAILEIEYVDEMGDEGDYFKVLESIELKSNDDPTKSLTFYGSDEDSLNDLFCEMEEHYSDLDALGIERTEDAVNEVFSLCRTLAYLDEANATHTIE